MVHSLGNCLTSKPGKYMKIYGCALDFHQIKSNNVQLCLVLPTGGFDRIKFQPFQSGVGPLPVSGFLGGVPCAVGSLKSELRHATEMFNSRQKKNNQIAISTELGKPNAIENGRSQNLATTN
jgi:hypothetical protein